MSVGPGREVRNEPVVLPVDRCGHEENKAGDYLRVCVTGEISAVPAKLLPVWTGSCSGWGMLQWREAHQHVVPPDLLSPSRSGAGLR